MKNKKTAIILSIVALVVVIAVLLVSLMSCGGSAGETKPTKGGTATVDPNVDAPASDEDFYADIKGTTILAREAQTDENKQIVKAFEEKYGVTFKFDETQGDWDTKFAQQISSGKTVDITHMYDKNLISYILNDVVQPVDPYIDLKDPTWDLKKMELHSYKGKHYGLVNALRRLEFGGFIVYNKTMFDDAGQTDPYTLYKQGNWNFDTFLSTAKAMTQKGKDGTTSVYGFNTQFMEGFLLMNGNTTIQLDTKLGKAVPTLNQPNAYNALQLIQNLLKNGYASTAVDWAESFKAGRTAMVFERPGIITFDHDMYNNVSFEMGFAPPPKGSDTGDTYYLPTIMWTYAIPTKAANPKGAAAYYHFYGQYQKAHENDPELKAARERTYTDEHHQIILDFEANSTPIVSLADGVGNWGKGVKAGYWNAIVYDFIPPATAVNEHLNELQKEIDYTFNNSSLND